MYFSETILPSPDMYSSYTSRLYFGAEDQKHRCFSPSPGLLDLAQDNLPRLVVAVQGCYPTSQTRLIQQAKTKQ